MVNRACVLDASALLCLLNDEPGSQTVSDSLADCVINAVNLSEAAAKLVDYGMNETDVAETLSPLHLTIVAFDDDLAIAAALIRRETRRYGLSFGDRACLATAAKLGLVALTADRAWSEPAATVGIDIRLVR